MAVTSFNEQMTEPAVQDSTEEQGIWTYDEEEEKEIKEYLS